MRSKSIKISHLSLLFVGIALSGSMLFLAHGTTVSSLTGSDPEPATACSTTHELKIYDQSSTVLASVLPPDKVFIRLVSPQADISAVAFRINGDLIGRAQKDATGTIWTMPWLTTLYPTLSTAEQLSLRADVYKSGSSGNCFAVSPYTYFKDPNQAQASIVLNTDAAGGWSGALPLGSSESINSSVVVDSYPLEPTPFTLFEWKVTSNTSTSIGYVTSVNNVGTFHAMAEGTGAIVLEAVYGGDRVSKSIPISVGPATAPLPELSTTISTSPTNTTTTTTTSPTSSPSTRTTSNQEPLASASTDVTATSANDAGPTTTIQNTVANRECLRQALSSERYDQINSGQSRPSPQELEKLKSCFASTNYVIPNNFSPVDPLAVKDLPKTKKIKITTLENVQPVRETGIDLALKISGKADPDSTVLIYVFSSPLVLTTTADSYGNWEYTLEDPLEPGNHEVYTVVDRGNGVYERSAPISFVIATAQAGGDSGSSANGLSLRLADAPTPGEVDRSLWYYLVGAGGVLIISVAAFLIVLNYRHHRRAIAQGSPGADGLAHASSGDAAQNTVQRPAEVRQEPIRAGGSAVAAPEEQSHIGTSEDHSDSNSVDQTNIQSNNIGALPEPGKEEILHDGHAIGDIIAPNLSDEAKERPNDQ